MEEGKGSRAHSNLTPRLQSIFTPLLSPLRSLFRRFHKQ